jgi:hypothetical protein
MRPPRAINQVRSCSSRRTHEIASKADCPRRDAGFRKVLGVEEKRLLLESGDDTARGLPGSGDRSFE